MVVVLEFAVLFGTTPADPDIYGHVTFGNEILKRGTLPTEDIYSYTAGSTYWINHEWLSEVLFASAWRLGGFTALHWLKVTFLVLYLCCFFIALKQLLAEINPLKYIFFAGVLGLALYPYLFVRPQLITFLFVQLLLIILLQYLEHQNLSLYVLPVLFVVWTNAHGGFIAGLGLLGLTVLASFFLYPEEFGELFLMGLLCLLGTLINPYGYYIYHQLFRTFSNPYTDQIIQDWQSVLSVRMWSHPVVLSICLIFLVYGYFYARSSGTRRRQLMFTLTVVCFIVGLMDVRNLVFVALIGLPALVELTPPLNLSGTLHFSETVTGILLVGLVLAGSGSFKPNPNQYFPEESVQYIKSKGLNGNLAVSFNWGQYCIFHLHPKLKVSLDGRYDTVYLLSVFEDFELKAFQGHDWRKIFRNYGTDYALVPKSYPLHASIEQTNGATRLFSGPKATVYEVSAAARR